MQAHVASDSPRRQKGGRGGLSNMQAACNSASGRDGLQPKPDLPGYYHGANRSGSSKQDTRTGHEEGQSVNRNASATGAAVHLVVLRLGLLEDGAGDGDRTRDIQLGKLGVKLSLNKESIT
jgi:hypothetical protein